MSSTILICEDDPDLRAAMRRTLRGYDVHEVGSPHEAKELLKRVPCDAIVSDFSMDAESDGLDLLAHVKLMYPDVVRFLVTEDRGLDVAVRAVNEGAVHRYFLKPWSDDQLRDALELLLHSRKTPGPAAK